LTTPQFLQNFAAPEVRRFQLSLNRDGPLVVFCAPYIPWRRRESLAQKHEAVSADRLAKKRIPHASGIFTGALNPAPIMRESPLRQSTDTKPQLSASRGSKFSNQRDMELPDSQAG